MGIMKRQKLKLPEGYYCKQVCGWYAVYTFRNEFTGIRGASRYDAIMKFYFKKIKGELKRTCTK